MGWLFTHGQSLKDLMKRRSKTWSHTRDDGVLITGTCLKHCFRGNVRFKGVFWTVWEVSYTKDGKDILSRKRHIGCDLMESQPHYGWGYKDMDESCGPYYFNCPFSYLKMVPCANVRWRIGVSCYHIERKRKAKRRAIMRATRSPVYS